MIIAVAVIAFLMAVASNFESGVSSESVRDTVAFAGGLLIAQVVILIASARIDHAGLSGTIDSAIEGAFKFRLVMAVLGIGASFVENFIR